MDIFGEIQIPDTVTPFVLIQLWMWVSEHNHWVTSIFVWYTNNRTKCKALTTEHILDSNGVVLFSETRHVQASVTQQNLECFLRRHGIKSRLLTTHNTNCFQTRNVQLTADFLIQPSQQRLKEPLKHDATFTALCTPYNSTSITSDMKMLTYFIKHSLLLYYISELPKKSISHPPVAPFPIVRYHVKMHWNVWPSITEQHETYLNFLTTGNHHQHLQYSSQLYSLRNTCTYISLKIMFKTSEKKYLHK